ncbi:MAG: hypothetical protein IH840_15645 [Candidatus Heimdallarchaeota archaeon]|nr:hypothetical protein [Candidatus Heimdallarchaeota archaeon]
MKQDGIEIAIDVESTEFLSGTVIDFVDTPEKQGIVIIDTCGHRKDHGDNMARFLRSEIENGWGINDNAREELSYLGKKLSDSGPDTHDKFSDLWHDFVSGEYLQFDGDKIYLQMGGGLGSTMIFRNDGELEDIMMKGGVIDRYFDNHSSRKQVEADPVYETNLKDNEMIFLQSDGLRNNTIQSIHNYGEKGLEGFDEDLFHEDSIADFLKEHVSKSSSEIRDVMLSELGRYFHPRDLGYDDVTFAVVKKR